MFGLFKATPQVKVEITDRDGGKTTFYRNVLPPGESNFNEARKIAKQIVGNDNFSTKVTYPK